jgi:hypothetical protein
MDAGRRRLMVPQALNIASYGDDFSIGQGLKYYGSHIQDPEIANGNQFMTFLVIFKDTIVFPTHAPPISLPLEIERCVLCFCALKKIASGHPLRY